MASDGFYDAFRANLQRIGAIIRHTASLPTSCVVTTDTGAGVGASPGANAAPTTARIDPAALSAALIDAAKAADDVTLTVVMLGAWEAEPQTVPGDVAVQDGNLAVHAVSHHVDVVDACIGDAPPNSTPGGEVEVATVRVDSVDDDVVDRVGAGDDDGNDDRATRVTSPPTDSEELTTDTDTSTGTSNSNNIINNNNKCDTITIKHPRVVEKTTRLKTVASNK